MAKRRFGYWWLLLLAGAIVAALLWGLWPRPAQVDVAVASIGSVVVSVREDGKTRVRERYVVSSPLTGQVLRIDLDPGDRVEQQQTELATLQAATPGLLDARSRSEAMARIRAARALVKQAETAIEKARQASELAGDEYQRAVSLIQRGVLEQSKFDQIEHQERMAQADLRSSEFALQVAQFEQEQAEAAFIRDFPIATETNGQSSDGEGEANTPMDDPLDESFDVNEPAQLLTLLSPVSGRVLRVFEESAGPVQVGTPLLELGDPVDLEVEVDVLSEDAVRIQPGAAVEIDQWGGSGVLQGVVSRVEPAAFIKVSALGVEEHRVNVIIDFREPSEKFSALGDGYRIEAAIEVERAEQVLVVPADALFREGDRWALFVIDDSGIARKQRVEIGLTDGLVTQIVAGISNGAQVISHPSNQLADGQAVVARESQTTE